MNAKPRRSTSGTRRSTRHGASPPSANYLPPSGTRAFTLDLDGERFAVFVIPPSDAELPAALTLAERAVARAVLEGCSTAEIALSRGTSASTVANQLRAIYGKLGVRGRVELIHRFSQTDAGSGSRTNAR